MSYGFEITGPLSKLSQSNERMGVFLSEVSSVKSYSKQRNTYRYRVYFETTGSVTQSVLAYACAAIGHPTAYMTGTYERSSNSVFIYSDRTVSTSDLKKSVAVFLPIFAFAKNAMGSKYSSGLAVFSDSGTLTYDSNFETIVGSMQYQLTRKEGDTPQDTIDNGKLMIETGGDWADATNVKTVKLGYSGGRSLILHQEPYVEARYTYESTTRHLGMFRVRDQSNDTIEIRSKMVRASNSGSGQYFYFSQPILVLALTTYPRI